MRKNNFANYTKLSHNIQMCIKLCHSCKEEVSKIRPKTLIIIQIPIIIKDGRIWLQITCVQINKKKD